MHKKETGHLIFTDGSSLGNPGPGGWGAILISKVKSQKSKVGAEEHARVIELGGGEKRTTNNRMELRALIEGLRRIDAVTQGLTLNANPSASSGQVSQGETLDDDYGLTVYLDSSYVHKGATQWSYVWMKNDWQTKAKKDVENRDLWEILLPLLEERKKFGKIIWKHIPGHSGIPGNERADAIATGFAKGNDVELFEGELDNYAVNILDTAVDEGVALKRTTSRAHSRAKAYSYLSLLNGEVMRHTNWTDCERRVKGRAGARYKKALSPENEKQILREWGSEI